MGDGKGRENNDDRSVLVLAPPQGQDGLEEELLPARSRRLGRSILSLISSPSRAEQSPRPHSLFILRVFRGLRRLGFPF